MSSFDPAQLPPSIARSIREEVAQAFDWLWETSRARPEAIFFAHEEAAIRRVLDAEGGGDVGSAQIRFAANEGPRGTIPKG